MALASLDFYSETLFCEAHMRVLIPERRDGLGYTDLSNDEGKLPVIVLLPGLGDGCSAWTRYTALERYVRKYGIAVVMPAPMRSLYADMKYGEQVFTYMAQEVLRKCCEFFPQISARREDHYAVGCSMGGYGALKLALGAGENFGFAAGLSAAADMVKLCRENVIGKDCSFPAFGDCSDLEGSDNDLFALAEKQASSGGKLPEIYLWCGTDDVCYEYNHALRDALRKLGYRVTYSEREADHQWNQWDREIQNVLKAIIQSRGAEYIFW